MCHYITGVLLKGGDSAAVKGIAEKFRRKWEPIANPFVQRQLKSGETYFLTTRGTCDCGTVLGWRVMRSAGRKDATLDTEKLRKQGWSQAKIERWIESKRSKEQHRDDLSNQANSTTNSELQMWLSFLRQVLETKASVGIGLLLHYYDGGIESEAIQLTDRQTITLDELNADFLQEIQEDVLYMVIRSKAG